MSNAEQDPATAPAANATPKPKCRFCRVAFITLFVLSLGLNIFVLGWFGARWWVVGGGWHDHMHSVGPVLEETWDRHAGAVDTVRVEVADALEDVANALSAEPFQPDAYNAAVERLSNAGQSMVEIGGLAAQDIGVGLNARQREYVVRRANRMARRLRNWDGPGD